MGSYDPAVIRDGVRDKGNYDRGWSTRSGLMTLLVVALDPYNSAKHIGIADGGRLHDFGGTPHGPVVASDGDDFRATSSVAAARDVDAADDVKPAERYSDH